MALCETQHSSEVDLFRQELVNLINLRHPLVQLAHKIDWKSCDAHFGGLYATGIGRLGQPTSTTSTRCPICCMDKSGACMVTRPMPARRR